MAPATEKCFGAFDGVYIRATSFAGSFSHVSLSRPRIRYSSGFIGFVDNVLRSITRCYTVIDRIKAQVIIIWPLYLAVWKCAMSSNGFTTPFSSSMPSCKRDYVNLIRYESLGANADRITALGFLQGFRDLLFIVVYDDERRFGTI